MAQIPKMYVANKLGHKMGINEEDFDPSEHTPWTQFAAETEEETGEPAIDVSAIKAEIEAAESLGALATVAVNHSLKFPGNVKRMDTARKKLLSQLPEG